MADVVNKVESIMESTIKSASIFNATSQSMDLFYDVSSLRYATVMSLYQPALYKGFKIAGTSSFFN